MYCGRKKYMTVRATAIAAHRAVSRRPDPVTNMPRTTAAKIARSIRLTIVHLASHSDEAAQPPGDRGRGAIEHHAPQLAFLDLLERSTDQREWGDTSSNDANHPVGQIGQQHGIAVG